MIRQTSIFACVLGLSFTAQADVLTGTNASVIEWGFAGTGPVTEGPALLYPSTITITGGTGPIADVNVTLLQGLHTWADDMEIALVSPSGTVVELMNDAGGSNDIAGDLTFDDEATMEIGDLTGDGFEGFGTFRPSVYEVGMNNPLADGSMLSLFDGESANGNWSLYVFDDAAGDTGQFMDGWSIEITLVPAPASAGLLGLSGLALSRRRR